MLNSFYTVLKGQTSEALQQPLAATALPPPTEIVGDKVKVHHRTYQIVGITTHINGEMTTRYAGMSPVHDHNGVGLATDIKLKVAAIVPDEQLSRGRRRFV
jgi:hypothetical protein